MSAESKVTIYELPYGEQLDIPAEDDAIIGGREKNRLQLVALKDYNALAAKLSERAQPVGGVTTAMVERAAHVFNEQLVHDYDLDKESEREKCHRVTRRILEAALYGGTGV